MRQCPCACPVLISAQSHINDCADANPEPSIHVCIQAGRQVDNEANNSSADENTFYDEVTAGGRRNIELINIQHNHRVALYLIKPSVGRVCITSRRNAVLCFS